MTSSEMLLCSASTVILYHDPFNGYFPGGPQLAGTRMSLFWILLELKMMEMAVTTAELDVQSSVKL